jgi:hypothetical protein
MRLKKKMAAQSEDCTNLGFRTCLFNLYSKWLWKKESGCHSSRKRRCTRFARSAELPQSTNLQQRNLHSKKHIHRFILMILGVLVAILFEQFSAAMFALRHFQDGS